MNSLRCLFKTKTVTYEREKILYHNNFAVISPFTILFTHPDNPLVLNINWKFPDCFFQFKI